MILKSFNVKGLGTKSVSFLRHVDSFNILSKIISFTTEIKCILCNLGCVPNTEAKVRIEK